MLLTHEKFSGSSTKPIVDTKRSAAALFSISVDSLEEVNAIMENGLNVGGFELHSMRNYGFMQQRTIEILIGLPGKSLGWRCPKC